MKKKITLALALLSLVGLYGASAQKAHLRLRERFTTNQYKAPIKKSDMGNPDSSLFYTQSGMGGPLVESTVEVYTYDGSGNIIKRINKSASDGQIYGIDSIIFDNNGREIEYYNISEYNNVMMITRIEYSKYGASDFQTIYSSYSWDGGMYKFDYGDSTVLTLDNENRIVEMKSYSADNSTNYTYEAYDFIELSYNGTEKLPNTAIFSEYDNTIMDYVPYQKIENAKWRISDPNNNNFFEGNFTEAYYYEYDMGNWVPLGFDSSIVNNGRIETRFNYEWDGTDIFPQGRVKFTYDNKNTLVKTENDVYIVSFWVNTYTSTDSIVYGPGDVHLDIYNTSTFTNQQGTTTNKSRRQNFFPSNVKTDKGNAVIGSVYPNPSSSILNLKLNKAADKAEIINLEGRVIQVININSDYSAVNIQNLTPGMYILRLSNHDGVQNIKFIKQ